MIVVFAVNRENSESWWGWNTKGSWRLQVLLNGPQCFKSPLILNTKMITRRVLCQQQAAEPGRICSKFPGPWFNIKMSSYQYRKSHCDDKTVVRSFYLHNGISYTGKMSSLYWIRPWVLRVLNTFSLVRLHYSTWETWPWKISWCFENSYPHYMIQPL